MTAHINPQFSAAERAVPFERVVLVLQGGGALGAYQAGVYEALAEAGESPPLKWSDLRYVFWHQGGPICRGSATSPKRLSPS